MLNGRSACRSGHPCEPDAGVPKEVLHCAVQHCAIGLSGVAARIGLKPSTLADMVNPSEPDWPSMRKLVGILAATADHPVLARYFAELQGGVFFPVPTGAPLQATADAVREFGELLVTQADSTRDGVITAVEFGRLERDGKQVMAAIAALIDDARRRAQGRLVEIPRAESGGR